MVVRLNIIEFSDTVQMPKMKWSNAIAVKSNKKIYTAFNLNNIGHLGMIKRGNEIKQGEKNIVFSGNQGDLVIYSTPKPALLIHP